MSCDGRADPALPMTRAGTPATVVCGGTVFNTTDPQKFRGALRSAGFYAEWKEKYGPDTWALFERQVGVLG